MGCCTSNERPSSPTKRADGGVWEWPDDDDDAALDDPIGGGASDDEDDGHAQYGEASASQSSVQPRHARQQSTDAEHASVAATLVPFDTDATPSSGSGRRAPSRNRRNGPRGPPRAGGARVSVTSSSAPTSGNPLRAVPDDVDFGGDDTLRSHSLISTTQSIGQELSLRQSASIISTNDDTSRNQASVPSSADAAMRRFVVPDVQQPMAAPAGSKNRLGVHFNDSTVGEYPMSFGASRQWDEEDGVSMSFIGGEGGGSPRAPKPAQGGPPVPSIAETRLLSADMRMPSGPVFAPRQPPASTPPSWGPTSTATAGKKFMRGKNAFNVKAKAEAVEDTVMTADVYPPIPAEMMTIHTMYLEADDATRRRWHDEAAEVGTTAAQFSYAKEARAEDWLSECGNVPAPVPVLSTGTSPGSTFQSLTARTVATNERILRGFDGRRTASVTSASDATTGEGRRRSSQRTRGSCRTASVASAIALLGDATPLPAVPLDAGDDALLQDFADLVQGAGEPSCVMSRQSVDSQKDLVQAPLWHHPLAGP